MIFISFMLVDCYRVSDSIVGGLEGKQRTSFAYDFYQLTESGRGR